MANKLYVFTRLTCFYSWERLQPHLTKILNHSQLDFHMMSVSWTSAAFLMAAGRFLMLLISRGSVNRNGWTSSITRIISCSWTTGPEKRRALGLWIVAARFVILFSLSFCLARVMCRNDYPIFSLLKINCFASRVWANSNYISDGRTRHLPDPAAIPQALLILRLALRRLEFVSCAGSTR